MESTSSAIGTNFDVKATRGLAGFTDPHCKVNDILVYRSKDRGKTWSGPTLSTAIPYNQHAWVPLVPDRESTFSAPSPRRGF